MHHASADLPAKGWQVIDTLKQGIYNTDSIKQRTRPIFCAGFYIVWTGIFRIIGEKGFFTTCFYWYDELQSSYQKQNTCSVGATGR